MYILYFLESLSVCAVDLFYMLTGYFMAESYERRVRKPLQLLIQLISFELVRYLLSSLLHSGGITLEGVVKSMVPANYFVVFYCVIWFVSPYINRLMDVISAEESKKMIFVLGSIFAIYCTMVQEAGNIQGVQIIGLDSIGIYGSQDGYNIVNFIFVYIIGAYIRRFYRSERSTKRKLLGIFFVNTLIITIWAISEKMVFQIESPTAWIYCNPLVILNAALLLMIFLKLDFGVNRVINWFSRGVFSVFLLHVHFISHIGVENAVRSNALFMIIHLFVSTTLIFVICSTVDYFYKKLSTPILNIICAKFDPIIVSLNSRN